ncbi:OsmC family protein [Porticoccaceae bacterium]|jgi:organic hydroperoxide reductase OsmC/OhrA|nr:OsmC family protein [Porticoccaceae bacterium]
MSEYSAKVVWKRQLEEIFTDNKYSRGHIWEFDGGAIIAASSAPSIVPLPYSVAANVDPEEAFIASISSCHMLFFLAIAGNRGFVIDQYIDNPIGIMEKDAAGKTSITNVSLRPQVTFGGDRQPTLETLEMMHHQSHDQCFIANSVKTEVVVNILP